MAASSEQYSIPPQVQKLYDLLTTLKSLGIHKKIALPQMVMCGVQSSGKSAVLESVTGFPFPSAAGLCTSFATQFDTTPAPEWRCKFWIEPGDARAPEERDRIAQYTAVVTSSAQVQIVYDEAIAYIGVQPGKLCDDVLHIEMSGPNMPLLSLVDLPGVICVPDVNTTQEDCDMSMAMVARYMASDRTIILAVVSATVDFNVQTILATARQHDPSGRRTMGIMTHIDRVQGDVGASKYLELAIRQTGQPQSLGWHITKNPGPGERCDTLPERRRAEWAVVDAGPWKQVEERHKGSLALSRRLTELQYTFSKSSLVPIRDEVVAALAQCQQDLSTLAGQQRTSVDLRVQVARVADTVRKAIQSAFAGVYPNAAIRSNRKARLAEQVDAAINKFHKDLRDLGQAVQIISADSGPVQPRDKVTTADVDDICRDLSDKLQLTGEPQPAVFDETLTSELFRDMARNWDGICDEFITDLQRRLCEGLMAILATVAPTAWLSYLEAAEIGWVVNLVEADLKKRTRALLDEYRNCEMVPFPQGIMTQGPEVLLREATRLVHDGCRDAWEFGYQISARQILDAATGYHRVRSLLPSVTPRTR
jgi:hypothetical protein